MYAGHIVENCRVTHTHTCEKSRSCVFCRLYTFVGVFLLLLLYFQVQCACSNTSNEHIYTRRRRSTINIFFSFFLLLSLYRTRQAYHFTVKYMEMNVKIVKNVQEKKGKEKETLRLLIYDTHDTHIHVCEIMKHNNM